MGAETILNTDRATRITQAREEKEYSIDGVTCSHPVNGKQHPHTAHCFFSVTRSHPISRKQFFLKPK
jgi:hypothetical protein